MFRLLWTSQETNIEICCQRLETISTDHLSNDGKNKVTKKPTHSTYIHEKRQHIQKFSV